MCVLTIEFDCSFPPPCPAHAQASLATTLATLFSFCLCFFEKLNESAPNFSQPGQQAGRMHTNQTAQREGTPDWPHALKPHCLGYPVWRPTRTQPIARVVSSPHVNGMQSPTLARRLLGGMTDGCCGYHSGGYRTRRFAKRSSPCLLLPEVQPAAVIMIDAAQHTSPFSRARGSVTNDHASV